MRPYDVQDLPLSNDLPLNTIHKPVVAAAAVNDE